MFNINHNGSRVPFGVFVAEIVVCVLLAGLLIYGAVKNTVGDLYGVLFLGAIILMALDLVGRYVVFTSDEAQGFYMPISSEQGPHYFYRDFHYGLSVVERVVFEENTNMSGDIQYSFINDKGEYITDKWFDGVSECFEEGVAIVMQYDDDGAPRYNVINEEGKFVMINWVHDIGPFSNGLAKIYWEPDSTVNYVRPDGSLLWKEWQKSFKHNSLADAYEYLNANGGHR